jgi:hypothetical protein
VSALPLLESTANLVCRNARGGSSIANVRTSQDVQLEGLGYAIIAFLKWFNGINIGSAWSISTELAGCLSCRPSFVHILVYGLIGLEQHA